MNDRSAKAMTDGMLDCRSQGLDLDQFLVRLKAGPKLDQGLIDYMTRSYRMILEISDDDIQGIIARRDAH